MRLGLAPCTGRGGVAEQTTLKWHLWIQSGPAGKIEVHVPAFLASNVTVLRSKEYSVQYSTSYSVVTVVRKDWALERVSHRLHLGLLAYWRVVTADGKLHCQPAKLLYDSISPIKASSGVVN